jgi:KaiC/GvpD/RAD55 family RecA-like ATPase
MRARVIMATLVSRVPTGIPGLDEMINGGFIRGRNIIVSGTPGTGKTTLAMQFIYNGAKLYNEPGIFVSTSEPITEMIEDYAMFNWDLRDVSERGLIRLSQYDYSHNGSKDEAPRVRDLVKGVTHVLEESDTKFKRLALDSISMLSYSFDSEQSKRIELDRLFRYLEKHDITSVFVMEKPHNGNSFTFEEFLGDGIVSLQDYMQDFDRLRGLSVMKMRGTGFDRKMRPYTITPDGLAVFSSKEMLNGTAFRTKKK